MYNKYDIKAEIYRYVYVLVQILTQMNGARKSKSNAIREEHLNSVEWNWVVIRKFTVRSSLVVQWLGLCAFTAVAWVQSLIGELRSHKLLSTAKKKKRKSTMFSGNG